MLRSDLKLAHVRRARRTLTMTATCAGLALGVVATTGLALAAPVSAPDAGAAPASVAPPMPAVTVSGSPTLAAITADADQARDDVDAALAGAASVEADIASAGLALPQGETSVDTGSLEEARDRLASSPLLPVLMLPAVTQNAAAESEKVADRVAELRGSLNDALAEKAAAEAAAEAQRQAEEAAAAEAQREADAAAALARVNTPEGAKVVAAQMASERYGWGSDQFSCLSSLWQKESSWNYQAFNAGSGATGIPQSLPGSKMASAGADWATNAATQIAWGLDYIDRAYGTPCSAWGHSQATDWY